MEEIKNKFEAIKNDETKDLSLITKPYQEVKAEIEIFLESNAGFSYWFCDEKDNPEALSNRLKFDFKDHNPHELVLSMTTDNGNLDIDPWESEIIPYANKLSQAQIQKAILILRIDQIPPNNIALFLRELVVGIDHYIEKSAGEKRYPLILITPKNWLSLFLTNNEETMPNWQGFKSRLFSINVINEY